MRLHISKSQTKLYKINLLLFCMIKQICLFITRSDVILGTCLITMFILLLIVALVAIVTWRLRKKPGEFRLFVYFIHKALLSLILVTQIPTIEQFLREPCFFVCVKNIQI